MLIPALGIYALLSSIDVVNAAATVPRDPPSLTVPLRRRDVSKRTTTATLAAKGQALRQKYNRPTRSPAINRRQGSGAVSVTDEHADSSYSAVINLGTPGQSFGVILDTGSSDLWVASSTCSQGCRGVQTFNSGSSSSFSTQNQDVTIQYGSGAIEGTVATDQVSIGGFSMKSQTFAVATQVSPGLLDGPLSGLLGLGWKSIANTGATPLAQALAEGSSLSSPLMAIYLARFSNSQDAQDTEPDGGTFTLGATNGSLFTGDIDFVNIPSTVTPGFWLLPVTGITVQGSAVTVNSNSGSGSTSQLAAIDTGTTLIGGPSDGVAAIYNKIPGSSQGSGDLAGYWEIPCSTNVNVSMSFGGTKSWPISPADFQLQAQGPDGSTICVGAIFDLDGGSDTPGAGPPQKRQSGSASINPAWIVGDSFLKNVYSVFRFDPPSVGFAQLSPSLPGAGATPGPAVGGINTGPSSVSSTIPPTHFSTFSSVATASDATRTSADALPSNSSNHGNGELSASIGRASLAWTLGLAGVIASALYAW